MIQDLEKTVGETSFNAGLKGCKIKTKKLKTQRKKHTRTSEKVYTKGQDEILEEMTSTCHDDTVQKDKKKSSRKDKHKDLDLDEQTMNTDKKKKKKHHRRDKCEVTTSSESVDQENETRVNKIEDETVLSHKCGEVPKKKVKKKHKRTMEKDNKTLDSHIVKTKRMKEGTLHMEKLVDVKSDNRVVDNTSTCLETQMGKKRSKKMNKDKIDENVISAQVHEVPSKKKQKGCKRKHEDSEPISAKAVSGKTKDKNVDVVRKTGKSDGSSGSKVKKKSDKEMGSKKEQGKSTKKTKKFEKTDESDWQSSSISAAGNDNQLVKNKKSKKRNQDNVNVLADPVNKSKGDETRAPRKKKWKTDEMSGNNDDQARDEIMDQPIKKKNKKVYAHGVDMADSMPNTVKEELCDEKPREKKKKHKKNKVSAHDSDTDQKSRGTDKQARDELMNQHMKKKGKKGHANEVDTAKSVLNIVKEDLHDGKPKEKKKKRKKDKVTTCELDTNRSTNSNIVGRNLSEKKRKRERHREQFEPEEANNLESPQKKLKLNIKEEEAEAKSLTSNIRNDSSGPEVEVKHLSNKIESTIGQWGTATFESTERQQKFMRLMGGFRKSSKSPAGLQNKGLFTYASTCTSKFNQALSASQQSTVFDNLEKQFKQAQEFKKGKGGGFGFVPPPGEGKKFYINESESKSVKFDD